jgi:hypothetical protein
MAGACPKRRRTTTLKQDASRTRPALPDPDTSVVSLPVDLGASGLDLLAFIGGLPAAAAMVIVANRLVYRGSLVHLSCTARL